MPGYKLTMYTYKSLDTNHQNGSALALSRQNCMRDIKVGLSLTGFSGVTGDELEHP